MVFIDIRWINKSALNFLIFSTCVMHVFNGAINKVLFCKVSHYNKHLIQQKIFLMKYNNSFAFYSVICSVKRYNTVFDIRNKRIMTLTVNRLSETLTLMSCQKGLYLHKSIEKKIFKEALQLIFHRKTNHFIKMCQWKNVNNELSEVLDYLCAFIWT